jgi:hypothetical protein
MTPQPRDWRHLAEQASKEMDSDKMMVLINELNRALDVEDIRRIGKKAMREA